MKYLFALLLTTAVLLPGCKSSKKCTETSSEGCICTKEYNPVCGCNDKTYSNPCMAECHGITEYTPGRCPDEK